jgi:hypothetical protein
VSWSLYRWAWRLEAPLSVGLSPSGSLNRCRLYVPARNLWGALTAELAQRQATGFPDYQKVGEAVRKDLRLTYLFPAEEAKRGWRAWLPRYESGRGLAWQREDDANWEQRRADREMRQRLLLARPGTAIDHASATAADGTLRETECMGQYWRCSATGEAKSVALVGYVFVCEGAELAGAIEAIKGLTIGGDARYGLGRVRRVAWDEASDVFGNPVDLVGQEPSLRTDRVLAHAQASASGAMLGQLEALGGWDRAKDSGFEPLADGPLWAPGSRVSSGTMRWYVKESGLWRGENNRT